MGARHGVWVGVAVVGVLLIAAGIVWLFIALGAETADRISSGIGAGAAVVGLLLSVLGLLNARAQEPGGRAQGGVPANSTNVVAPAVGGQSVENSTITGANIQVGGSVTGGITAYDPGPTGQDGSEKQGQ